MNFRLLSKILGLLLLLLSAVQSGCLLFAWLDRERRPGLDAVEAFAFSLMLTFGAGALLFYLGRKGGREVLRREAIAIVGLGWLVCGAFGALPYMVCEPNLSPAEAFFESMSGFTTTGASVMVDITAFPRSILLWRSLTQWLGGLGILVLFVALLSYLGVGSKALFRHESTAKSGEGLQTRIRDVAMRLWQIYLVLSLLCCGGLIALGMSVFDAVAHTFTAVSTGGFSTRNESIAYYDNVGIELWLALFMIFGSISFMLYAWLLRGRWERWTKDEETRVYLWLLFGTAAVIGLDILYFKAAPTFGEALRASFFQTVSIMTTTGYATDDFDRWPPFSRVLLLLLMFIGGCTGSTSGGIKVSRWLLFFKLIRANVIATFRPNQVIGVHLNGNLADDQLKIQTMFFVALAAILVGLGTAVISVLEPDLELVSCFSAVLACISNIGPGLEAVGPTKTFAGLTPATHLLLSLLMVMGRLEHFAILVLFFPSLWRKY